jgi:ATP-dependent DNA ligase
MIKAYNHVYSFGSRSENWLHWNAVSSSICCKY